jgi:hypothetical protein
MINMSFRVFTVTRRVRSPYTLSLYQQAMLCLDRGFLRLNGDATTTTSRIPANIIPSSSHRPSGLLLDRAYKEMELFTYPQVQNAAKYSLLLCQLSTYQSIP